MAHKFDKFLPGLPEALTVDRQGTDAGNRDLRILLDLGEVVPPGYTTTHLPGIIMPTEVWEGICPRREKGDNG